MFFLWLHNPPISYTLLALCPSVSKHPGHCLVRCLHVFITHGHHSPTQNRQLAHLQIGGWATAQLDIWPLLGYSLMSCINVAAMVGATAQLDIWPLLGCSPISCINVAAMVDGVPPLVAWNLTRLTTNRHKRQTATLMKELKIATHTKKETGGSSVAATRLTVSRLAWAAALGIIRLGSAKPTARVGSEPVGASA